MVPAFLRPAPDSMFSHIRRGGGNPKLQLLHVLWSVWLFMTPFFTPVHASFWWSLAISYPIFLLLFTLTNVRPYEETGFYSTGLALLACLSMPSNPSAWTYGVFACVYVYVPYFGSLRASALKIVLIELVMLVEIWWLRWPWGVSALLVGVCTSSGFGSLMGRVSAMRNMAQRLSQDEVRRLAATAERERIGRDLHDLLGHTLSLITMKLELSRKLLDRDQAAARRELADAEEVARHALAEVRAAVTGIRAAGFAAELASVSLLLRTSGVQLDQHLQASNLPESVECALALVLREATTNIARHAHATLARVSLTGAGDSVRLCIEDNGRGGIRAAGNGLSGMRERVQALGGTLQVDSPPGGGTRLSIDLPLTAKVGAHDTGLPRAGALASPQVQHAT
jgi:two-component system sensor histidine kinase DesK